MTGADIIRRRLRNQLLVGSKVKTPAEVVSWFGAVQAQEYTPTKWSLGLRAPGLLADEVERAFAEGAILRTHVMRPTWHFVAPADLRWLLALTAPHIHRGSASYNRQLELDPPTVSRSHKAIARALEGGACLTRAELGAALTSVGIVTNGQRLAHLMMHAELDRLICSGPRRGRQFTYALFDDRVPRVPDLARDEALAMLAHRYFRSHGPATMRDFAWWSGLPMKEVRDAIAMARPALAGETVDGHQYWFDPATAPARVTSPYLYLLPIYDEFGIAYRDRDLFTAGTPVMPTNGRFAYLHVLFIDGRLAGRWKWTENGAGIGIGVKLFRRLRPAERAALDKAASRHGRFFRRQVEVSMM